MKKSVIQSLILVISFLSIASLQAFSTEVGFTLFRMRNLLPSYYAMHDNQALAIKIAQLPGIDVNVKGIDGRTALHWAAQKGFVELAEALLAKGATTTIKDNEGQTPLDIAQSNHQEVIASLLSPK